MQWEGDSKGGIELYKDNREIIGGSREESPLLAALPGLEFGVKSSVSRNYRASKKTV